MMKYLFALLILVLVPSASFAQCNGVFPAGAVCGNPSGSAAPPQATTVVPGTSSTFIQSGAGAVTRTAQDKGRDKFDGKDFGVTTVTCDGTTDVATNINQAIAAVGAAGRGTIDLVGATCAIGSTLTVTTNNVVLRGQGMGNGLHNTPIVGNSGFGTQLKWIGSAGGTMMSIIAPNGGPTLNGNGLQGISFNCDNSAAIGLIIKSHRTGYFNGVQTYECTTAGLEITTTGPLASTEPNDSQHNVFISYNCWIILSSGSCILLDGTAGIIGAGQDGNASFNSFENTSIVYKNGNGLTIKNADNNLFNNYRAFNSGGSGYAAELTCNQTSNFSAASNIFIHFSGGAVIARGTETCVNPTVTNQFYHIDSSNNTPTPTVGTNATISWLFDTGFMQGKTTVAGVVRTTGLTGLDTTWVVPSSAGDTYVSYDIATGASVFQGYNTSGSRYGYLDWDLDGASRANVLRFDANEVWSVAASMSLGDTSNRFTKAWLAALDVTGASVIPTVTGATVWATGASADARIGQVTDATTCNGLFLNGTYTIAGMDGVMSGCDGSVYLMVANTANSVAVRFANSTKAFVTNNGILTSGYLQTGSTTPLTLTAGAIGLSTMAASGTAAGAAGGKLELVCGTNSGTAKLIIYAGTSTTPEVIKDNIGGGVTGC